MMPMLVLSAAQPGILYINGRFAGELSPDAPLLRPAAAHGALLLDYRPMEDSCRPMVRRLVFSGGKPLIESIEAASGVNCVIWPGGIVEIELAPQTYFPTRQTFSLGGLSFLLEDAGEPRLSCANRELCSLPAGSQIPQLHSLRDGLALLGCCAQGMYLVTTDAGLQGVTGCLHAKEIEIQEDGRIRSLIAPGDIVGHAAREEWQLTPGGLQMLSRAFVWEDGMPRWPQTPEETAIAAVEAAMAGLDEEAEGYLLPGLRERNPLPVIAGCCDLCVPMKYAPPQATPSIGLLKLEGGSFAQVTPLHFRAVAVAGKPFPFLLEALELT